MSVKVMLNSTAALPLEYLLPLLMLISPQNTWITMDNNNEYNTDTDSEFIPDDDDDDDINDPNFWYIINMIPNHYLY